MPLNALIPDDIRYYTERINIREYRESYEQYCRGLELLFSAAPLSPAENAAGELMTLCGEKTKKRFLKKLFRFDLSQFLIFYTLPALLGQESEYWKSFADELCRLWNNTYTGSKISPCPFEELMDGFGNTIFGFDIKK